MRITLLPSLLLSSLLVSGPAGSTEPTPRPADASTMAATATNAPPTGASDANTSNSSNTSNASATRSAGARWLVANQHADGGWGAASFARRNADRGATGHSDIATTALAVMALQRDAGDGEAHQEAIRKGLDYVLAAIEKSPSEGVTLNGPTGTQPQGKLGPNVDTHFAALLLGEVDRRVGDALYTRTQVAYDKVLTKVVSAQRADGSFDANGWAPVLSSSVAAQSLYKALDNGKQIDREVMLRSLGYNGSLVDEDTGRLDASKGAGVDLYAAASALQGNRKGVAGASTADRERAERKADKTAERLREDRAAMIRGFGSVGGEEMLSYMMISDTLAEERGRDWQEWQGEIARHLRATQNGDGSWSGHHCITSTPFVTAAAVMTLGAGEPIEAAAATPGAGEPIEAAAATPGAGEPIQAAAPTLESTQLR